MVPAPRTIKDRAASLVLLVLVLVVRSTAVTSQNAGHGGNVASPYAARRLLQAGAVRSRASRMAASRDGTRNVTTLQTFTTSVDVDVSGEPPNTGFTATALPRDANGNLFQVDDATLNSAINVQGATCTIQEVMLFVRLSACGGGPVLEDGTCSNKEQESSYPNDIRMALIAPDGTASARLVNSDFEPPATWRQSEAGPIEDVPITFDQASSNFIGSSDPSRPTEGTFRPVGDLGVFNGLDANGAWTLNFENVFDTIDPSALLEWRLIVTCLANPVPTCEAGTFIRPGTFFWGSPETLTQSPTGGWPDVCAKTFDECQNDLNQARPGTLATACACELWDCLQPCFDSNNPGASLCPATGGPQPDCPPFELRRYLCDQLKAGGETSCGASSAPFPADCATLVPAGVGQQLSKHVRRSSTS